MAGLELIITVDSGPAHAAASLAGPDVWVLLRHEAHAECWRWGDPAWYPDARVRRGDCRATGAPVAGRNDRCSVQQPNEGWPKSTLCSILNRTIIDDPVWCCPPRMALLASPPRNCPLRRVCHSYPFLVGAEV
jgi:hypothetical protein